VGLGDYRRAAGRGRAVGGRRPADLADSHQRHHPFCGFPVTTESLQPRAGNDAGVVCSLHHVCLLDRRHQQAVFAARLDSDFRPGRRHGGAIATLVALAHQGAAGALRVIPPVTHKENTHDRCHTSNFVVEPET